MLLLAHRFCLNIFIILLVYLLVLVRKAESAAIPAPPGELHEQRGLNSFSLMFPLLHQKNMFDVPTESI